MISGLIMDLRHALRVYGKTPWQSALAVLTMAIAMALVGGMASLWSDLHLGGAPGVEDSRGLVTLGRDHADQGQMIGADSIAQFNQTTQTLTQVTGESQFGYVQQVAFRGEPISGPVAAVLPGYFETLTPRVLRGRGLTAEDFANEGARVLVLGHGFWQERLGADPGVIGTEIRLGEDRWRIVGIMNPGFTGLVNHEPMFWAPYKPFYRSFHPNNLPEKVINKLPFWRLAGRLEPDAGIEAAEAELAQFVEGLPDSQAPMAAPPEEIMALAGLVSDVHEHFAAQKQVTLMLLATLLVALVATINVGTFLLARVPARSRELALRRTVGASVKRLAGQLLLESALLVVAGTLLGVVLSIWLAAAFRELSLFERVSFSDGLVNVPALGFCAILALVLSALVASVPLSRIRRNGLVQSAVDGGGRPGAFQFASGLIQLSLTAVLAAAAVGFLAHLWILDQRDMGLSARNVFAATLTFAEAPSPSFKPPPDEATFSFREELRDRLGALPGVERVSFGAPLPGQRSRAITSYTVGEQHINAQIVNAAPGFFDLLEIERLAGRSFQNDSEPGVLVSRAFVRQAWGEEADVVGRFLRKDEAGEGVADSRILGVVEDVRYEHPARPLSPMVFSSSKGFMAFMNAVLIRGQADLSRVEDEINAALETHLDQLKVERIRPLAEIIAELTRRDRARSQVTLLFGAVIVLMTAFGFFAMQRFLVDTGRRERAIRMAIGAGPSSVRRHVLVQGLKLGAPGLVVGGLLAVLATAWLVEHYLDDGVSPPLVAVSVIAGLLALLLLASLQPAWAAARLRPGEVLKEE